MAEFRHRSTSWRLFLRFSAAIYLMLFVLASRGSAQAPALHLHDAWGLRLGVLGIPEFPGTHPLIAPYYETATSADGRLTMIADLTLAFTDFANIDFPSYSAQDQLSDYGFHGGVRYAMEPLGPYIPFGTVALGFDVYPDPISPDPGRVSASFPFALGVLRNITVGTQIEFAAIARPQWYFRQGWSFAYGLSIGGRFPSLSE